ncbi:hypothetical protein NDU88_002529 [Pleurodeles waltl]|uniref:L1 transposable element RRM domain-containing protein n=1 Tax=Pleurodeles waltl TaxID=8319 RepID=A0AAV7KSG3_PLEWA|nr:hypothetical protein NDU88_002529 [Pleurodeles waltl]
MEQRVSNLEDVEHRTKSTTTTSLIQSELEDLQLKLDEAENRSRRSNLRFLGIPEGTEEASSVTNVISELIYKVILSDKDRAGGDLSIMRAHRVPFTRPVNSKYPRTILVNFVDFPIKEQILSQARAMREFKSDDKFTFRVFADMLVVAAHRRREFVGLIDNFKMLGASAGIAQLAKLKVVHKGQTKVFQNVQDATNIPDFLKKSRRG